LADRYHCRINGSYWIFIGVGLFWLLFETYNYYTSVFKHPDYAFTKFKIKSFPFKPSWGNLIYDLITDIGFFWLGAFLAGSFYVLNLFESLVVILPFALLLIPSAYWYTTRMYIQQAGYPVQYRLSQWDIEVDDAVKMGVHKFRYAEFSGTHLMIFGNDSTINSMLGIAIANEMSFKHKKCTYINAMELCDLFGKQAANQRFFKPKPSWQWNTANFLVIDDITVTDPQINHIETTEFFNSLCHNQFKERNLNVILEKKIIWIFGADTAEKSKEEKWVSLLREIGVKEKNIITIHVIPETEKQTETLPQGKI
jgi:hypothetical protein